MFDEVILERRLLPKAMRFTLLVGLHDAADIVDYESVSRPQSSQALVLLNTSRKSELLDDVAS